MDAYVSTSQNRRRSQFSQGMLFCGALLPFGLSLCFHINGPVAQPASPEAEKPALVFSQYMVNLGPVPPGRKYASARFVFTNRGSQTITLEDPIASCQCIDPRLKDQKYVYEPGERGEFYVTIETPREPAGDREYLITVPYHQDSTGQNSRDQTSQQHEVELTFRATLPQPQVSIHPKALLFYQLNGQADEKKFSIIDNRPSPLEALAIETTSKLVTAKIVSVDNVDGIRTITVSVSVPGEVPEKRVYETVNVRTNDGEYRTLRIPVMIEGRKISIPRVADDPSISPPARQ